MYGLNISQTVIEWMHWKNSSSLFKDILHIYVMFKNNGTSMMLSTPVLCELDL